MKYAKTLYIPLWRCTAALMFWACEKDDICPENSPKTPDARVEFYVMTDGRRKSRNVPH